MQTTPEKDPVAREVIDRQIDAYLAFGRDIHVWARGYDGVEVTVERVNAVLVLERASREGREVDVKAIAEALGLSPSTASRNVYALERAGLVEKRLAEDARRIIVELSMTGRQLARWVGMKIWTRWVKGGMVGLVDVRGQKDPFAGVRPAEKRVRRSEGRMGGVRWQESKSARRERRREGKGKR